MAKIFVLLFFVPFGCVSGSGGNGVENIVERSKAAPPAWISLSTEKLTPTDGKLNLIVQKTKVLDLPLGISQTQTSAREDIKIVLFNDIAAEIMQLSDGRGIKIENRAVLEQNLRLTIESPVDQDAKVSDIYYEKIRDEALVGELRETYRVYVLMTIPISTRQSIIRSFAEKIKGSSLTDLKAIGTVMLAASEG